MQGRGKRIRRHVESRLILNNLLALDDLTVLIDHCELAAVSRGEIVEVLDRFRLHHDGGIDDGLAFVGFGDQFDRFRRLANRTVGHEKDDVGSAA